MTTSLGHLLIVDDETELVSALSEMLTAQGYETEGFTSGYAALHALSEKNFDVLLTDLMMPELGGLAVLQAALEIDPHLIGIMMTGHGTVQTAVEAMKVGAFDYILKPFKLNALLPVLSRAMQLRRVQLENIQLRETVAIYELTQAIASTLSLSTILDKVTKAAYQQCQADQVTLWLPTGSGKELYIAAVSGEGEAAFLGKRKSIDEGEEGWVAEHRVPRLQDTVAWVPVLAGGKLEGVLHIDVTGRRRPLSPGDIKALNILVSIAGPVLENVQLFSTLQESKVFTDTIIDSLPGLFYVVDHQFRMIRWNKYEEELLGLPSEQIWGMYWPSSIHEEDREHLLNQFRKAIDEGYGEAEVRVLAWDGPRCFLLTAVRLEAGNNIFVVGTGIDITGRKQAEDEIHKLNTGLEQRVIERTMQLEAANRELEAFSYTISHDLRAPLRAIDGFSHLLGEQAKDLAPESLHLLQTIQDNVHKMSQLIEGLLGFSRLSRQPLQKNTVDLAIIVRQVLGDLESQRGDRQIEVSVGELASCQADPFLMRQVYYNLLANAFKFTSKRDVARIEVGYERVDDRDVYFVKDNGAGFDMRYIDKLFGVFQRLHRAQDYEGTGVGLAITQRIINRHGGRIWAEAAVDKGAAFYFTLEGAS